MIDKIKEILTIMKERKFDHHSNMISGDRVILLFHRHFKSGIIISAKVIYRPILEIKDLKVELEFLEMKMLCKLSSGEFWLMHPEFNKFVKTIRLYARACIKVNPFKND